MKLETLFFNNASSATAPTTILEGAIEIVAYEKGVNYETSFFYLIFQGTAEELAYNKSDLADEVWNAEIENLIVKDSGILRIELAD